MFVPTEPVVVLSRSVRVATRLDSSYRELMTLRVTDEDIVLHDRVIDRPSLDDTSGVRKMEWVAGACTLKNRDPRFIIKMTRGVCYTGPLSAWYAESHGLRFTARGIISVSGPSGIAASLDKYLLLARIARLDRNSHYGAYAGSDLVA